ncbi:hypothetical protein EVG20_g8602 [Dentipellis fragilis]|uniref:Uncharacterized protein n=1 Tax=Dentipellis fragilis TaxID=205917 RepID=A0A4Y9Y5B2_9AGAM|nr:hypothetical protein EVG20_g8602 [Dentipellis fragilis]
MQRTQSFSNALPTRRSSRPQLLRAPSSKSLLHPRKLDVPVPPSLAHSPLLLNPHSIFRRSYTTTRVPTKRDEEWLRDTVPAPSAAHHSKGVLPLMRWWSAPDTTDHSGSSPPPPQSPPLVHWRVSTLKPAGWGRALAHTHEDGDVAPLDAPVMSAL